MILVTGATGTVGRVVAQLLVAGEKVRVLTRNPSRVRLDERVEIAAGDLNQPETVARTWKESIVSSRSQQDLSLESRRRILLRRRKKPGLGTS